MVQLAFNAQTVQPTAALDPVPSDNYTVMITKSEEKPTKKQDGSYIELELSIQQGQYKGRKVYDRLNIKNTNETAVTIAYSTLSAICHVTGRLNIQDTAQLHNVPFQAVVVKVERKDQPGTFSNEVRGYKDVNGKDPGFAGTTANPAAQPNWAGGGQAGTQPFLQQNPGSVDPNMTGAPAWQQQPNGGAPQQQNGGQQPQGGAPQANQPPAWGQQPQGNGQAPQQMPQQPQQQNGYAPNQQMQEGQPAGYNGQQGYGQQPPQQQQDNGQQPPQQNGGAPSWAAPTNGPSNGGGQPQQPPQNHGGAPSWAQPPA